MQRLIDADRLIDDFDGPGGRFAYGSDIVRAIISRINVQPTIDPVKHGKWIFDLSGVDWTYGPYVCSECHARNGDFIGGGLNKRTNYCPNCGAKMDADE